MMSGNIAVVYEKGMLRPLRPLNLPERTQLQIRIVQPEEGGLSEADKAYRVLVQAGLLQPVLPMASEPVSESDRLQAARAYGDAGSLSDWIIAERNDA